MKFLNSPRLLASLPRTTDNVERKPIKIWLHVSDQDNGYNRAVGA